MVEEEAPAAPPLQGRHVRLRPVVPPDYDYLYQLASLPEVAHRWRMQGAVPNPQAFNETLWRDVLVQFMVEDTATGQRMGLVSCFAANMREGFAHVAIMMDPRYSRSGVVLAPLALLVNYVLTIWNFRKLYMESAHFNYLNIRSGEGRLFHEEGRLRGHTFFKDRYWDVHILAIYREDWEASRDRYLRLALGRQDGAG